MSFQQVAHPVLTGKAEVVGTSVIRKGEAMPDVLAAAGNLTLGVRVTIEFADGEAVTPDIAVKLSSALEKATARFSANK